MNAACHNLGRAVPCRPKVGRKREGARNRPVWHSARDGGWGDQGGSSRGRARAAMRSREHGPLSCPRQRPLLPRLGHRPASCRCQGPRGPTAGGRGRRPARPRPPGPTRRAMVHMGPDGVAARWPARTRVAAGNGRPSTCACACACRAGPRRVCRRPAGARQAEGAAARAPARRRAPQPPPPLASRHGRGSIAQAAGEARVAQPPPLLQLAAPSWPPQPLQGPLWSPRVGAQGPHGPASVLP